MMRQIRLVSFLKICKIDGKSVSFTVTLEDDKQGVQAKVTVKIKEGIPKITMTSNTDSFTDYVMRGME